MKKYIILTIIFCIGLLVAHSIHYKVDNNKCIGCETCVSSCPEEAISVKNGKAVIDSNKCIQCGKCFNTCPVNAIRDLSQPRQSYSDKDTTSERDTLKEKDANSQDSPQKSSPPSDSAETSQTIFQVQPSKCSGEGTCVKVCQVDAISIKDDQVVIDPQKCIQCGKCVKICPVNAIQKITPSNKNNNNK